MSPGWAVCPPTPWKGSSAFTLKSAGPVGGVSSWLAAPSSVSVSVCPHRVVCVPVAGLQQA